MMIQGQQLQKDIVNTVSWSFVIGCKILQTIYRHPRKHRDEGTRIPGE